MVEPGTLETCNTEKPFEAVKLGRTRVQRIPSRSRASAQSKTGYICADQTVIFTFRLRQSGGPYIPYSRPYRHYDTLARLSGLIVVCFGRFWVRGLPFPNARHLGHPFRKNTLPWHPGPPPKSESSASKLFRDSGVTLVVK
jgi:hypothetical protein